MADSDEPMVEGFGVYDEWGPLREVFVGRADTFRFGGWSPIYEVTSPEFQKIWKENEYRLASEVWPDYTREFQEQLDGLAEAYEANGVTVHRPRPMTELEIESDPMPAARGVWQGSPADAQWVVGRNYIETAMRVPLPRKNFLWGRDVFAPRVEQTPGARWLACPRSAPTEDPTAGPGPYLDGGDIILVGNGRDVLVGLDDHSTDRMGIRWLSDALADDGYKVWPMTFEMIEVHLLAHLNLIRPGLGIICRAAFEGHGPLPEPIRDWDFIEITPEDVHNGGADVVMLDENTALVSQAQPKLAEAMAAGGIEPQIVDLTRAAEATSGVRCCTIIVHREKAS